jgi:Na+/H+ antiporter NhaB
MEVSKLPNIRLIDPKVSSWHLLRNELATITINSTAGYEGLFMRKPCFCLANVFYDTFSGVTKIRRIDELKDLLTEEYIDKKKREIDEGFKDDLRSLLSSSCHGGIGFGYTMLEPKNINKLIKLLHFSLEEYGKD